MNAAHLFWTLSLVVAVLGEEPPILDAPLNDNNRGTRTAVPAGDSLELFGKVSASDVWNFLKTLPKAAVDSYIEDMKDGMELLREARIGERLGDIYASYISDMKDAKILLQEAAEKVKSGALELYERIPVEDIKATASKTLNDGATSAVKLAGNGRAAAAGAYGFASNNAGKLYRGAMGYAGPKVAAGRKYVGSALKAGGRIAKTGGREVYNKGKAALAFASRELLDAAATANIMVKDASTGAMTKLDETKIAAAKAYEKAKVEVPKLYQDAKSGAVSMFEKVPWEQLQAYAETEAHHLADIAQHLYAKVPTAVDTKGQLNQAAQAVLAKASEVYAKLPIEQARNFYQSAWATLRQRATDAYVGLSTDQALSFLRSIASGAGSTLTNVAYEKLPINSGCNLFSSLCDRLHGVKTYAFRELTSENAAILLAKIEAGASDAVSNVVQRVPVQRASALVQTGASNAYPVFVRYASDAWTKAGATATGLQSLAVGLYHQTDATTLKMSLVSGALAVWNHLPNLGVTNYLPTGLPRPHIPSRFLPHSEPINEEMDVDSH